MPRKKKADAELGRANLLKELASKTTSNPPAALSNIESKGPSDQEEEKFDDLIEGMGSLAISVTKNFNEQEFHPLLSHLALQRIFLRIPSLAHPNVKEFLSDKFGTLLHSKAVGTKKLCDYLLQVNSDDIEARVQAVSREAGIACDFFLVPPVHSCILCNKLLDSMISKRTQVVVFSDKGVKAGTKFRYR